MELKEKAKVFEEEAFEAFSKERYFLVLFFVEQSIQLYIKHILLKKFGDYPKTHNLRVLFKELNKVVNLQKFLEENEDIIDLLVTSYIESRYTEVEFSKKSAEKALEFLKKFKEIIKDEL